MTTKTNTKSPQSIDKNSVCYAWFMKILDNRPVDTSEEEIMDLIKKELKIDLTKFDSTLMPVVPHMFVVFIKSWSGWQFMKDYRERKFTLEHFYARFRKYLTYKMQSTLKATYDSVIKDLRRTNPNFMNDSASASSSKQAFANLEGRLENLNKNKPSADKQSPGKTLEFAPYTLEIKCPPQMLNTMVFTTLEDDIIIKQHVGRDWVPLTTTQLIHWPNVGVTFVSQDLFFMRFFKPDNIRYLNFIPQEFRTRDNDNVVESITNVATSQTKASREAYTLRLINAFVDEYVKALKLTSLKLSKLEEIQTILYQFLEDIRFMDLENQSIANHMKILFKMTSTPFIRNKKLVMVNPAQQTNKEADRVGYCEKITPRIELLLKHFRAVQSDSNPTRFTSTNILQNQCANTVNGSLDSQFPKIYYKCLFCNKDFVTERAKKEILDHLSQEHKMEQPVRCTKCKQQFDVLSLAASRWKHTCES